MLHRKTAQVAALALLIPAALLTIPLKATLVTHVLLQFPMLIVGGVLLGISIGRRPRAPRETAMQGIAALLLAGFCLAFWMLPRWLDAAVLDLRVDALKIASLVLLVGMPLGWGWRRVGALARAFTWANAVSMLAVLGVFYVSFQERLCNNYLVNEQAILGSTMLAAALVLFGLGALRALAGKPIPSSGPSAQSASAEARGVVVPFAASRVAVVRASRLP